MSETGYSNKEILEETRKDVGEIKKYVQELRESMFKMEFEKSRIDKIEALALQNQKNIQKVNIKFAKVAGGITVFSILVNWVLAFFKVFK